MPMSEGGYKQFKIGDLFDIHPTKAYKYTNRELFIEGGENPVVANSSTNNGIGGYSNLPTTEEGNMITFSDTTTSDAIFYQPRPFIGYPHVQGLYPKKYKSEWNEKTLLYVMSLFRKCAQGRFDYATKFTRILALEMPLLLPVDKQGEIDFDFIESRVRELEEERVRELEAYLKISGFTDCSLTLAEKQTLDILKEKRTKQYRIDTLFEKIETRHPRYKVKELPTKAMDKFTLPALTAGIINQGLSCFVPRDEVTVLNNVISVSANGANTGAMFFQPFDFTVLQDAYAIKRKDGVQMICTEGLFYVTALEKIIRKYYDWSNKAGWNKIKNLSISLPVDEHGNIDYEFITNYINAIQKQTIARLQSFIQREKATYQKVINN